MLISLDIGKQTVRNSSLSNCAGVPGDAQGVTYTARNSMSKPFLGLVELLIGRVGWARAVKIGMHKLMEHGHHPFTLTERDEIEDPASHRIVLGKRVAPRHRCQAPEGQAEVTDHRTQPRPQLACERIGLYHCASC
jgi:hypothetical protein